MGYDLSSIDFAGIYGRSVYAEGQPARYKEAIGSFEERFGPAEDINIFSAPGRTEICGNHTDHQHGQVLAASIDRDAIAIVKKTDKGSIRLFSGDSDMFSIDLDDLDKDMSQEGTTWALIKGVARALSDEGYKIGSFDAYVTSDVLIGAGLSSSASFETLIGTIISGLYNDMKIDPVTIAKAGKYAENHYFGKPSGLMDQIACSVGNAVYIDFRDPGSPEISRVDLDLESAGYDLLITDTKGSHSDLTPEYAAIPEEMRKVAELLGHEYLRDVSGEDILNNIVSLRENAGDRAVLRAIHFTRETRRAEECLKALEDADIKGFINLIRKSGDSSYKFLQNIYPAGEIFHQNMAIALALSEEVLSDEECARVHGGGFAGTIQAFVRKDNTERYRDLMDKTFGEGSCQVLNIRKFGGIKVL